MTPLSDVTIEKTQIGGFSALYLSNGLISTTIVPELGGKLASLKNEVTGKEWLWRNPVLAYRKLGYGASYLADGDFGGWDECFPTVAACSFPDDTSDPVPDHGELWSQDWQVDTEETGDAVTVRGLAEGRIRPYAFSRGISLARGTAILEFSYRIENLADRALPFIWSAHPLLSVRKDAKIHLPPDTRLNTFFDQPSGLVQGRTNLTWPLRLASDDHSYASSPLPRGESDFAFKVWSNPLRAGRQKASVSSGDDVIAFSFDGSEIPNLGVWVNAGGWAGRPELKGRYYTVAIEPCIGAQDRLDEAVRVHNMYGALAPHQARTWLLRIELGSRQEVAAKTQQGSR